MENTETLKIILQQLKERKIRLVMDDFETGYSSLSYLYSIPFHSLKIDKSFVSRMQENHENMGLVPATIGIAHSMGMKAIAFMCGNSQTISPAAEIELRSRSRLFIF